MPPRLPDAPTPAHDQPQPPEGNVVTQEAATTKAVQATTFPPPPPSQPRAKLTASKQPSFEDEFVMVLKDKIESEVSEMKQTGRMKRWTPLREDPMARRRLMEVMVAQIHS